MSLFVQSTIYGVIFAGSMYAAQKYSLMVDGNKVSRPVTYIAGVLSIASLVVRSFSHM